jgi:endopolyphosphatase
VFQRGAYYSVEVIPDKLAVISLNTMYFYDSNKGTYPVAFLRVLFSGTYDHLAIGGCKYKDHEDPGNLQFDWLEVQLEDLRSRRMQVRLLIVRKLMLTDRW